MAARRFKRMRSNTTIAYSDSLAETLITGVELLCGVSGITTAPNYEEIDLDLAREAWQLHRAAVLLYAKERYPRRKRIWAMRFDK